MQQQGWQAGRLADGCFQPDVRALTQYLACQGATSQPASPPASREHAGSGRRNGNALLEPITSCESSVPGLERYGVSRQLSCFCDCQGPRKAF